MAKIQISEGRWNTECTTELNLTQAHARNPELGYDKVITFAEKRYLMTFITAGATDGRFTVPGNTQTYRTRVPKVPDGELIDGKAWKYHVMGRIQQACEIVGTGTVGTPTTGTQTAGGFFSIKLKDNYLQPDMNALFYNGKIARVYGMPRNAGAYWIYQFQCFPGDTFSWDTWIAPQAGTKTLFGGYTTHGEKSLRGYGRVHYPDQYINHMTIQRKGASITGDANAERVMWYATTNSKGETTKGWNYWIEAQNRTQFALEDEFQKWWGKTTMKDSLGNLLSTPSMHDPETGMPIIAGDGFIEQIAGANDMETSGPGGEAVWDDFVDITTSIVKKSNDYGGKLFYCVTGTDGMANVNKMAGLYAKNNYNLTQIVQQTGEVGGASPRVGFNFQEINVEGNTVVFVVNPMMDDTMKFPRKLSNGKLAMSSTFFFVDMSSDETGKPNVEMRTRGREGVNRNMVWYYKNGMTGDGKAESSVDGKEFQMLKENMIVVYNPKSCGRLLPNETA